MPTPTSHTPGPWTAHDDDGTGTLPCVLAPQPTAFGNFYVAQCNVFADARLIALAPEMLAALAKLLSTPIPIDEDGQRVPEYEPAWTQAWAEARSLLRRARGEETTR